MKILTTAVAITIVLTSSALFADQKHGKFKRDRDSGFYDFGRVTHVEPNYRQVRISNPVRECWDEPVRHTRHRSADGMLVGGLLGGIVGHQIGDGRGKKLATAMGTVIGAQIGHGAVNEHGSGGDKGYTEYREHCEMRHQVSYEEVIDGYTVTYRYKGERYTIDMPYDPGKRIKLRVHVTPVI